MLPAKTENKSQKNSDGDDPVGPRGLKRKNFRWKGSTAESALLDWLEEHGNYELYKGSGKVDSTGKKKTTGKNRQAIVKGIYDYFVTRGVDISQIDVTKIKNKLAELEGLWKEANSMINQTGEGVDERDVQCESIKGGVINR